MDAIKNVEELLKLQEKALEAKKAAGEKHASELAKLTAPTFWEQFRGSKKAIEYNAMSINRVETMHKAIAAACGTRIPISPEVAKFLFIKQDNFGYSVLDNYEMVTKSGEYYLELGKVVTTSQIAGGNPRHGTDRYRYKQHIEPIGIAKDITIKQIEKDIEDTKAIASANAESDTPKADKPRFRHLDGKWVQQENGRSGNEDSGLSK